MSVPIVEKFTCSLREHVKRYLANQRSWFAQLFGKKSETATKSCTSAQVDVQNSTTTKWCTDCKWHVRVNDVYRCRLKPKNRVAPGIDNFIQCVIERDDYLGVDTCGSKGKYWESLVAGGDQ